MIRIVFVDKGIDIDSSDYSTIGTRIRYAIVDVPKETKGETIEEVMNEMDDPNDLFVLSHITFIASTVHSKYFGFIEIGLIGD